MGEKQLESCQGNRWKEAGQVKENEYIDPMMAENNESKEVGVRKRAI